LEEYSSVDSGIKGALPALAQGGRASLPKKSLMDFFDCASAATFFVNPYITKNLAPLGKRLLTQAFC